MEGEKKKAMQNNSLRRLSQLLKVVLVDSRALRIFLTNFLLAYNIRAGVAVLLRALSLLVKKPGQLRSFETLFGEKNLTFRVEAVRLGLFVGGFAATYTAVCQFLAQFSPDLSSNESNANRDDGREQSEKKKGNLNGRRRKWHSAVAGWLAGLSLYFMDKSWHRTLALYMATRAAQCVYNFAKLHGYWHFWGSHWAHGDALLFILSSAQVMYAYVMRPETLPASYYKFIVRQGPIDEVILQAVRDNNRGKAVNLPDVMEFIKRTGGEEAVAVSKQFLTSDKPKLLPARALHPYTKHSVLATLDAFKGTAKQIFPVYLSLALVPAVVLRFKNFVKAPTSILSSSLLSAVRSTTFLATFCSSYMGFVCLQRVFFERFKWKDHKLWYYVAGLFSSLSILIERKSRRSELALYAFPRAMDSLYMILYDHQLAFRVPQGEVLLFCTAMSSVMWFYENETACLSPLVAKLMDRFIPSESHKDKSKAAQTEPTIVVSPRTAAARQVSIASTGSDEDGYEQVATPKGAMSRNKSTVSLSGGYSFMP